MDGSQETTVPGLVPHLPSPQVAARDGAWPALVPWTVTGVTKEGLLGLVGRGEQHRPPHSQQESSQVRAGV